MNIQEIKNQLKTAIENHKIIEISFKNENNSRTLHPYHFGTFGTNEKLHAYQTSGPSESDTSVGWKNMELKDIRAINITGTKFTPPDKGYNPNSNQYQNIEFQIEYEGMGARRKPTKPK